MIRAFFGISLTPQQTEQLRREYLPLESSLKSACENTLVAIEPKFYHITLKFMAHIEPGALAELGDFTQTLLLNTPAFELQIKKIGLFPHVGGRVIAAFISPDPNLLALHLRLDQEGLKFGVARELRRYRPHITLGKFKSTPCQFDVIRESTVKIAVNSVTLYESRPGPQASIYIPLRVFPLKA